MKILHQINYLGGLGADRWIGDGFKAAFEDMGHEFFWLEAANDLRSRLNEIGPDILMIGQDMLTAANSRTLHEFRARGLKVVARVDSFWDKIPGARESLMAMIQPTFTTEK